MSLRKFQASIFILLLYVLPVILILLKIIPYTYRFHLLIGAATLIFMFTIVFRIPPKDLGFTLSNVKASFMNILPTTTIFSLPMLFAYQVGWSRTDIDNSSISWIFYLFHIFVSSPAQEFIYRGFLFDFLSKAGYDRTIRLTSSSILYSFAHAIYEDTPTMIFTLICGFYWGMIYEKYRNLYSVIFSHSVLGAMTILAGLI